LKQVFVTGASGGMGYGLTEALCNKGYRVWAGVRNLQTMQQLKLQYPESLTVVKLDMTSPFDFEQIVNDIIPNFNFEHEFILVNNAGIAIGSPIESLPIEEWQHLYQINLFGPVRLVKMFLPIIRKTKGRIINIGSISGRISTPFLAPYSSSKHALRSFTDSLRREVKLFGVKVILIEPGPTKTKIWSKSLKHGQKLESEMTDEVRIVYKKQLQSLRTGVELTAKLAIDADIVIKTILVSIESENPKFYYLVGKNIYLLSLMAKLLPTPLLDMMLISGFRNKK